MFTLRCGAQHRNVGHNHDIILAAGRQVLAEHIDTFLVEAERAVAIVDDVDLLPRLTDCGANWPAAICRIIRDNG